jgi:hypothetical protein
MLLPLNVIDQISHKYKTAGKVAVLYIIILVYLAGEKMNIF